jgi:hypothetical protein
MCLLVAVRLVTHHQVAGLLPLVKTLDVVVILHRLGVMDV